MKTRRTYAYVVCVSLVALGVIIFVIARPEQRRDVSSERTSGQNLVEPFSGLTDDELCDLLEQERSADEESIIVREVLRRKSPQMEKRLRALIQNINEPKDGEQRFALYDSLMHLTALRRIQGMRDPLRIEIMSIAQGETPRVHLVNVQLTNVDSERLPFAIARSRAGPIYALHNWRLRRSQDDRDVTPKPGGMFEWMTGYKLFAFGDRHEVRLEITGVPSAEYYLEYLPSASGVCAIRSEPVWLGPR